MLTSRVVVSRQSDRSAPRSPLPATSHVTKFPVVHPLSIQQVTKCFSRNSFVLKTIHFDGGCVYPSVALPPHDCHPLDCLSPILYPLSPLYSHSSPLICTFLHSSKTQLFSFQAIPHSASENGPGWGTPQIFFEDQNEPDTAKLQFHRWHPMSPSSSTNPLRLLASPAIRLSSSQFLAKLHRIDPILPRVGPAGHFPYSTQRPRS